MSLLEALLHPRMLAAAALYLTLSAVLLLAIERLRGRAQPSATLEWLGEHLGLPLLRALTLVCFLLLAYPVLFGWPSAPGLSEVLGGEHRPGRFSTLVNVAVLGSLLLPLLPVVGGLRAFILPAQGLCLGALLFSWSAPAGAGQWSLWPGWGVLAAVAGIALITHVLADRAVLMAGARLERSTGRSGFETLIGEGMVLVFQLPAILLYTLHLGAQVKP